MALLTAIVARADQRALSGITRVLRRPRDGSDHCRGGSGDVANLAGMGAPARSGEPNKSKLPVKQGQEAERGERRCAILRRKTYGEKKLK